MKTVTEFVSKDRKNIVKIANLMEYHSRKSTVGLIKEWRAFTGQGLKESKDAIEKALFKTSTTMPNGYVTYGDSPWNKDSYDSVLAAFAEHAHVSELSREEFIHIIEGAIDNMSSFHFNDMLDATMVCLENIKKNGGLAAIAEKNYRFLEGI